MGIGFRQILVIVVVAAGLWLLKRLQSHLAAGRSGTVTNAAPRDAETSPADEFSDMVLCDRCGRHVAMSEARGDKTAGYRCIDRRCVENLK